MPHQKKQEQMNIYTIKKYLLAAFIHVSSLSISYAQNWAIKPFIGGHYNIVDLSQNDAVNLPYGFSSTNHPISYTYGAIIGYQFNPKWGLEVGYKRATTSIWVEYTHPYTGSSLGSYFMYKKTGNIVLSANYAFYDNQKGLRLKALAGIEIQNNKNKGLTPDESKTNYSTDTNFVVLPNNNNRYLTYINMGISAEFLIKRKPLAELRITSGLGYRYNSSLIATLNYNGYSYSNTNSTTGTYLNTVLLLNVNTLFGKWKN